MAIDPNGRIATGPCSALSDEAGQVLQALLDDPRLQGALAAQHAPMPLRVGLWWIEEAPQELKYQGRAARVQRNRPAPIDAGSWLEIIGLDLEPSAASATVRFAYPDLAFAGDASFTRIQQRWRVAGIRLTPLEDISN